MELNPILDHPQILILQLEGAGKLTSERLYQFLRPQVHGVKPLDILQRNFHYLKTVDQVPDHSPRLYILSVTELCLNIIIFLSKLLQIEDRLFHPILVIP